jgi:feruloyl esterase
VARTYGGLPAFCRVTARLTPTDDSDIAAEVWLPAADWNGKYQAVGNGGFAGSIRHRSMAAALAQGPVPQTRDMWGTRRVLVLDTPRRSSILAGGLSTK